MKKLAIIASVIFSLNAGSAFATGFGGHHGGGFLGGFLQSIFDCFDKDDQGGQHGGNHAVPEIDAAGTALAIALLGGVVSIARERRKKA